MDVRLEIKVAPRLFLSQEAVLPHQDQKRHVRQPSADVRDAVQPRPNGVNIALTIPDLPGIALVVLENVLCRERKGTGKRSVVPMEGLAAEAVAHEPK
jgi:hypothetical protein